MKEATRQDYEARFAHILSGLLGIYNKMKWLKNQKGRLLPH